MRKSLVPTISDGMAMGTQGMKYSLISREVISDCIETCVQGQWMDGVLVLGGCAKICLWLDGYAA